MYITYIQLFQTTKIQIFESNSQRAEPRRLLPHSCFRLQRYKFLKAIHNKEAAVVMNTVLFQTTKIQIFESNSQPPLSIVSPPFCCFRLQRYKFLKAIHNQPGVCLRIGKVVSDYKDTNF